MGIYELICVGRQIRLARSSTGEDLTDEISDNGRRFQFDGWSVSVADVLGNFYCTSPSGKKYHLPIKDGWIQLYCNEKPRFFYEPDAILLNNWFGINSIQVLDRALSQYSFDGDWFAGKRNEYYAYYAVLSDGNVHYRSEKVLNNFETYRGRISYQIDGPATWAVSCSLSHTCNGGQRQVDLFVAPDVKPIEVVPKLWAYLHEHGDPRFEDCLWPFLN